MISTQPKSRRRWLIGMALLWALSTDAQAAPEPIGYTVGTIESDPRQKYFIEVLKLALDASGNAHKYELKPVEQLMSQERAFTLASQGVGLGVFWGMTSKSREQKANAIKIPLLKGLLGYRVLVTRGEWVPDLAGVENLDQLKRFSTAQGYGWPDNRILKSNGLTVYTGSYHALFDWVAEKRADLLPRSVYEVWPEQGRMQARNLVIAPSPVLYYFGPIYFFVPKKNTELAETIERGLKIAIEDGRFDKLFYAQEGVKNALAFLTNGDTHTIVYLENPEYSHKEVDEIAKKGYLLLPMDL
jgi:ABC-type amino acid transport substrate-binding protein